MISRSWRSIGATRPSNLSSRCSCLVASKEKESENGLVVFPVFGRGLALGAYSGTELTDALIEDISFFLCGACSCQAKALNPGHDLLIAARWDDLLFGPDPSNRPGPAAPASPAEPIYVPIPAGNRKPRTP